VKTVGTTDDTKPTEARIVELLRAADEALDTATIAARLGLHPNGVRTQLQRLGRSGLVESDMAHGDVGRPRVLWRVTPQAIAEADLPHTGWAMARSLARAIPATPARLREVEAAGVDLGLELAADIGAAGGAEGQDPIGRALGALGFAPKRHFKGATTRYELRRCPYAEAVRENPAVVCTLHRGIVQGVLKSLGSDAELSGFVPRPPDIAGCIVEITAPDGAGPKVDS
jgi:predicted ArsR family transcriptional regulator